MLQRQKRAQPGRHNQIDNTRKTVGQWLAGTTASQSDVVAGDNRLASLDLLASMEKQLAAFMQTVVQDEEIESPHLMNGHRSCPCCTERGE